VIVYGVYRNTDMTEGRGPMALARIYLHREHAVKFMDTKSGVMGRRPGEGSFRTSHPGCKTWDCQKCFGTSGGDWRVQEHEVLETEHLLPLDKQATVTEAIGSIEEVLRTLASVPMKDFDRAKLVAARNILEDFQS
jgi:hypothetical protein